MQIISSCTILLMMILNIVCAEKKSCNFTFTPAKITAVPGLCVLVSCTFACPDTTTSTETIMWKIILKNKTTEKDIETERFKMLEPDPNKNNCSFILEDIEADDAGEYTFRVRDAERNQIKTNTKVKIIIQDEPVIEVPPLREHEQANLSCSAPSPCPETPPHITWWITKREGKITEVKNDTTFTTSEVFYNSTLTFTPTSDLHNATVGCDVSYGNKINISTRRIIEVMHVKTLRILGNDTVKEGETLNLSCTPDSHPASSVPLWIFIGTTDKLQNISGENLSYTNVSKKHGGKYVCAVAYMNVLLTTSININIINRKDRNVTSNITAFLDFMEHTTTHVFLMGMGMGMATSAIIFSVLLCCWVSCKRAKKPKVQTAPADSAVNLKMLQTNIDLTVTTVAVLDYCNWGGQAGATYAFGGHTNMCHDVAGAPCNPKGRVRYCQWPVGVLKAVLGFASFESGTCQYPFIRSKVEMYRARPKRSSSSSTRSVGLPTSLWDSVGALPDDNPWFCPDFMLCHASLARLRGEHILELTDQAAVHVPFVAYMVDATVAVRILSKAQISLCLDDDSLLRMARQRGLDPSRLKALRSSALSIEVSKTPLGFYLPADSGEKVSLGVTVMLALTVFQLLVAEIMPPSENVPLIGKYYIATMTMINASTALTIFIMNIHHCGPEAKPVPNWAKKFILQYLARICFIYEVGENCMTAQPETSDHQPPKPPDSSHMNGCAGKDDVLFQFDRRQDTTPPRFPEDQSQMMSPCSLGKQPTCRYGAWREGAFVSMDYGGGAGEIGKVTGGGGDGDRDDGSKRPCMCEQQVLMRNIEYVANCYRDQRATAKRTGEWKKVAKGLDRFFMWLFFIMRNYKLSTSALLRAVPWRKGSVEHTFTMQIISSCTIVLMMILNIVCAEKKSCNFTFTPAKITAVPGLCVLVSCTFACPDTTTSTETIMWKIILKNKTTEKDIETERFKMLEPDPNKNNCSFILEDIKADDAGEYTFRVRDAERNQIKTNTKVKIIIQDEPVIEVPPLREHEQAKLSCSAPSPCPETPPHITWWITKREGKSEVFYNSTLTFTPTSDLHNATVGCDVSYGNKINISTRRIIEVMHVKTLRILGNDTVKEGETLNLSCTPDSHPASSVPLWIFIGTTDKLQNISGENLSYTNVSKKHGGKYVCAVAYMNVLLTTSININIINNSNETKNPDNPENQNMTGTDTKDTNVTSNIIIAFLDFMAHTTTHVFLMGMATSAIIFSVLLCCWVSCKRAKKPKVQTAPADSAVNLKMVQTNIDLTVTNEQTPLHNQSDAGMSNTPVESTGGEEESEAGGAEDGEAGKAAAGDVDYAAIDYSLLKKKSPEEGESKSMDTEYAEIKRDGKGRNALQNEHDHTEDQKQNEEEELYSNPDALKGQA
ncbi:uncharacterized protein LOC130564491 [Triplophysa rosa]|uniref:uncharacterized protein LOC130564491 n=1 Tax=Triplophysa rosa TaxID=992332 RepID=UPI002545CB3D|nr:uncharacterized protein LOC130564491 [Triplophysa rosa]